MCNKIPVQFSTRIYDKNDEKSQIFWAVDYPGCGKVRRMETMRRVANAEFHTTGPGILGFGGIRVAALVCGENSFKASVWNSIIMRVGRWSRLGIVLSEEKLQRNVDPDLIWGWVE